MARETLSSTFTGGNKAFSIYQNKIAGNSGLVFVGNTETDLLNSKTGKYFAKVNVLFSYAVDGSEGDNYVYRIRFNGVVVWQHQVDHSLAHYAYPTRIPLILPPNTEMRCTAQNVTDTSGHNQVVTLAGTVYDA